MCVYVWGGEGLWMGMGTVGVLMVGVYLLAFESLPGYILVEPSRTWGSLFSSSGEEARH